MASNIKQVNKEAPTYLGIIDIQPIKREIVKAEMEGKDTFIYKGSEILVAYAKYLVEYMSTRK